MAGNNNLNDNEDGISNIAPEDTQQKKSILIKRVNVNKEEDNQDSSVLQNQSINVRTLGGSASSKQLNLMKPIGVQKSGRQGKDPKTPTNPSKTVGSIYLNKTYTPNTLKNKNGNLNTSTMAPVRSSINSKSTLN